MQNDRQTDVSLLFVDDEPGVLEELQEWFVEEFGYNNIDIAKTTVEAKQKLEANTYDVIVSDMRMEDNQSGFDILHTMRAMDISSIFIILTANDTVVDCRRAFREKAWDYIPKTISENVFEELDRSIQQACIYINRWGNQHHEEWIDAHWDELMEKYDGQYIAVLNGEVIEHAATKEALNRAIEERQLRRFLVTVKCIVDEERMTESLVKKLIDQGESHHIEFKSSLQYDVRNGRGNNSLRKNVLKTIVAFLNSEGGTLLIGVEDNGNILGLDNDLSTFSEARRNIDNFEQHLTNLIKSHIGVNFVDDVQLRFEEEAGKTVCVVQVAKTTTPAFLDGEFFARLNNQTNSLNAQETITYLDDRSTKAK
jgi:DNA-binding NarL/FixJ family response regulator